jgi:hypothetical protein
MAAMFIVPECDAVRTTSPVQLTSYSHVIVALFEADKFELSQAIALVTFLFVELVTDTLKSVIINSPYV